MTTVWKTKKISMCFRPAWSTYRVLGQLYSETLSEKMLSLFYANAYEIHTFICVIMMCFNIYIYEGDSSLLSILFFLRFELHEVCIYVIKTLNDIYVAYSTLITLYTYVLLKWSSALPFSTLLRIFMYLNDHVFESWTFGRTHVKIIWTWYMLGEMIFKILA